MPADERAAFLDSACDGDRELRARVEAALAASVEEASTLPGGAEDLPTWTSVGARPVEGGDPYRLAGTRIGHYEIQERLGKGGMGVVYKALDTRLHRPVALKFLLLSLSDEPGARERFFAEARSASALDHNNICTIHEISETEDGKIYIVMAHYGGETLRQKMAAGRLTIEAALDYITQIASGLAAAHARGILHRDMKPANVIVTPPEPGADHGVAKILDFGLAKIEGNDLTRTGTTMGTVAYMSPEQAAGERVDQRADVWALGVMFYEMLTGERPFKGTSEVAILNAVLNQEPAPPSQIDPEIPAELEKIVLGCLVKDKDHRCAGVDQLLAALGSFLRVTASYDFSAGGGTVAAAAPARPRSKALDRRRDGAPRPARGRAGGTGQPAGAVAPVRRRAGAAGETGGGPAVHQ